MRNLCKLLIALALAGVNVEVACATSITAASNSISIGATPISTGVAVFVPVDSSGHGIAVTQSAGGLSLPVTAQPAASQPLGYTCSLSGGGVSGTCTVPDAGTSSPAGFAYNVTICDTSVGNPTSGQCALLTQVHGVTGAAWQLDHYSALSSISTVGAFTFTLGVGAPTGTGGTNALYADITTPTAPVLYLWTGTAWAGLTGSTGAVTATAIQTALASRSGCNSSTGVYVPNSNNCMALAPSYGAAALAIGDSHPQGFDTAVPTAQGYAALTSVFRGWNFTNAAVGGYRLIDLYAEYQWGRPVGQSTVTLIDAAVNDAIAMSTQQGGGASTLNASHSKLLTQMQQAWIAISGVSDTHRQLASEATLTGTWATLVSVAPGFPAFMEWSNTNGSSADFTCVGTRCDLVVLNTTNINGAFTVAVDGTPVVCPWPSNTTTCGGSIDYTGAASFNAAIYDIPIRGLASGTHTIHVQSTNGGGTAIVGVYASSPSDTKPLVIVANLTFAKTGTQGNLADSLVAAQQPIMSAMYSTMIADGFNLVPTTYTVAPTSFPSGGTQSNYWWNPNDASQTAPDGLHPNFLGYQHIANELEFLLLGK